MTVETRTDLKANMDTELADNVGGDISAQDVRKNMKDAADSAVFPEDHISLLMGGQTGIVDPVSDVIPSINGVDNTKFDISSGSIVFSDSYTDPANPVDTALSFAGVSSQTVTNIATQEATYLYISNTGTIVQNAVFSGEDILRDHVYVGVLHHADNTIISFASSSTQTALSNFMMVMADYSFCVGPINCKVGNQNVISGNTGTLGLDKASGCWFFTAINARSSLKNPNIIASLALVKPVIFVAWRTTDGNNEKIITQDTIPAGVYDDDTAVQADALPQGVLSTNQWVNHRVFMVVDSNQLAVQIGQVVYASQSAAIAGATSEVFETIGAIAGASPIATVTMRGAATDLSIAGDANIRQAIPPRATFQ